MATRERFGIVCSFDDFLEAWTLSRKYIGIKVSQARTIVAKAKGPT
ncbi:hypothetical protein [Mesorhizobium sp. B2-4-3]|nr:hypothetical protein [Mesorhizobium sp. B2-4-3]